MKIFITGGAGYIGSHVVWYLKQRGHQTIVFDNLSTGHREDVRGEFVEGDLCNKDQISEAIATHRPDAVMHFAALSLVGESVKNPRRYFYENILGAWNLLDALRIHGVKLFVFSSTAATYGIPQQVPIPEEHPQMPINPYGDTKLTIERMLAAYETAYGFRYATLRYFNAAGALPEEHLGERHDPETHLIPLLLRVALGKLPTAQIFGVDYDTPDHTCIRDYIHVLDLASAHLAALEYLASKDQSLKLNLGTGRGYSVLEVLNCARKVTGAAIVAQDCSRRPGDPPSLVAAADKAQEILGWKPEHSDLESIVASAWKFYQSL